MNKTLQRKALSAQEYRDVLVSHLAPMFPGVNVSETPIPSLGSDFVRKTKQREVFIRPDPAWDMCYRLQSLQAFEDSDIRLISKFTQAFHEKLSASHLPFFPFLVEKCAQDAVALAMQARLVDDSLLPSVLALLTRWSSETYEGQRIAAAIGIDPAPNPEHISNVHLSEIVARDYSRVLSNGLDTLLVLSPSGHIVEHVALEMKFPYTEGDGGVLAPRRHHAMANWASKTRVAFTLNRHGEILIFRDRKLQFAFRRGKWSHFTHSALIARMGGRASLMRSVYATCLDVSFSRKGGLIAVAKERNKAKVANYVSQKDLLAEPKGEKATLFKHIVGQPFQAMRRPIREELVGIDGATVLAADGSVLAVGAIVSLKSGSDGGGRKAAAKALSRLGIAIKVSADGGITAFTDGGEPGAPDVAFEVCV